MVTPLNPFKVDETNLLADEIRLFLVEKALSDESRLVASDYEFHLPRPSYTWDTLQALVRDYPGCDFVLVIGADNWVAFDRWYHAADILRCHEVGVYPREGFAVDVAQLPGNVQFVNARLYRVSSTDIRQRVAEGRPVRRLVPPNIHDDVLRLYSK